VTTEATSLLEDALSEIGKHPRKEICRWKTEIHSRPATEADLDFRRDPQHPLIYHLFGHLSLVDSLVLTEDDYFDFLIGTTEHKVLDKASLLHSVNAQLNNGSSLYIGFELGSREFRVMSRLLKRTARGQSFGGVAVQVDPEEDRILEPEGARAYLERHLRAANTDIYWGTADDFVDRLFKDVNAARQRFRGMAHASYSVSH
jgi:hypothetical protein